MVYSRYVSGTYACGNLRTDKNSEADINALEGSQFLFKYRANPLSKKKKTLKILYRPSRSLLKFLQWLKANAIGCNRPAAFDIVLLSVHGPL